MNGQTSSIRRHFSLVGQARESNDCGFFCGVVFSVAKQSSSFDGMMMSEEDVYSARDRYLMNPTRYLQNPIRGPGTDWLQPVAAPVYLESMGLRGNLLPQKDWRTNASTLANLEELLADPMCHGLMIVIGFHWIAIINPFRIGGRRAQNRVRYDPAPHRVPHTWEAPLPEIASYLHTAGPRSVVRVQRTL